MNIHGYELIGDWEVSNIGFTAIAKKKDKKYFLKRYGEYKLPRRNASTSEKLYAKLERAFHEFAENRKNINLALKTVACEGGNIILPTDWFVDDINFVEATEFVNNLLEDDKIMSLPMDNLLFIMMTAAKAVKEIHGKNIVHSDLKRSNILAARNSSGKIVAKIIDFDKSYFADKIRENDLGGDQLFMSPELTWCLICECEEDAISKMSTKSDIFSLGIVFYNYLTNGEFPKIIDLKGKLKEKEKSGKIIYCGEALVGEAKLLISKKIKDEYLKNLIANMLYLEPGKRISAQEVLDTLKTKRILPVASDQGIIMEDMSTISSARSITMGTVLRDEIPKDYCEPWVEHNCIFDLSLIKSYGFISSKQIVKKGINCYQFYKEDGTNSVFTINNLKLLGWIKAKTRHSIKESEPSVFSPSDEVWDTDSSFVIFNDKAQEDGYVGIAKSEKNGRKGYVLMNKDGSNQFVLVNQLKILGYAKRK